MHVKEEEKLIDMDELDKNILKILCENARMPLVEIGRHLRISARVVAYRIRKIEEKGIILGYRPNINNNLLGFTHYKIFFHLTNITEKDLIRLKQYLKTHPNVVYIVEETGICDIDVELMLKSSQDFFEFIRKLKFAFPTLIKEYEPLIIAETLKIDYLPLD